MSCQRRAGAYEDAIQRVKHVLKSRPTALDAQFEAASVYQDWAASRQEGSTELWDFAIYGVKADKKVSSKIWGWGEIAKRLDVQVASGAPKQNYHDQLLEAHYNLAFCRRGSGMAQKSANKKLRLLERAEQDIVYTTALVELDDAWLKKFDALFREIQLAMGKAAKPLSKAGVGPVVKTESKKAEEHVPKATKKSGSKKAVAGANSNAKVKRKKTQPTSLGVMVPWLVAILVAAAGMAGFFYTNLRKPKRQVVSARMAIPKPPPPPTPRSSVQAKTKQ